MRYSRVITAHAHALLNRIIADAHVQLVSNDC